MAKRKKSRNDVSSVVQGLEQIVDYLFDNPEERIHFSDQLRRLQEVCEITGNTQMYLPLYRISKRSFRVLPTHVLVATVDSSIVLVDDLQNALRAALTEWVITTSEGRKAWQRFNQSVTLALLADPLCLADSLSECLHKYGIVEIHLHPFARVSNQSFWLCNNDLVDRTVALFGGDNGQQSSN